MRLRGAYLSMHRSFNALFAQFGVTADQYVMLRLLSEEDGITQQELGRRMFSDANTVTAMLALLEKRKLLRRKNHARDGRARLVFLTPKGRRLFTKLQEGSLALHERLEGCVQAREHEPMMVALARIAETMAPKKAGAARPYSPRFSRLISL